MLNTIAAFYERAGQFDNAIAPTSRPSPSTRRTRTDFSWSPATTGRKPTRTRSLTPSQQMAYVQRGIEFTDRALAIDPNFVDSLVYKNLLLRTLATLEPSRREQLIGEADALRSRAHGSARDEVPGASDGGRQDGTPPPPPPPPPPRRS